MQILITLGVIYGVTGRVAAPSPPIPHIASPKHPSSSPPPMAGRQFSPSTHSSAALNQLFQDYWKWKITEFPQFATQLGLNDDTARRLDNLAPANYEGTKIKCEEFLKRTEAINLDSLSENDLINFKIFQDELSTFINNFKFLKYSTPVTFLAGPQHSLKYIVEKQVILKSYNDYQKLIERYGDLPRQAQEIIDIMKGNVATGLMPSNWSMINVIKQFNELGGPVEGTAFYKPFLSLPDDFGEEQKEMLQKQAKMRIEHDILPSFRKIRDFLKTDYLPHTRPQVGVSSLEGGPEFYSACLRFHTSTLLTPQEVHDLGLKEVARIQKEVVKTAVELGMEGKTISEISALAQNDPDQRFGSKEELLDTYRRAVYTTIYPLMDRLFSKIPSVNVTVEGKDDPNAIYASYSEPPLDGSRPGTFYLNSYIYDHHKRYEVTALSLHESVPGHHFHFSYILTNPTPNFRKQPDYSRDGDTPVKFPIHTAFTEGWGLYSEFLGEELGLYEDPYQRLGRHSFELLRASRLVVDTGLHALGWSRDRAIDYLLENTALAKEAVKIEINRYITLPGQACSYKIGEIKIKDLRKKAKTALDRKFNLKAFHNVILSCFGPLTILEECVDNYINRTQLMKDHQEHEKEEESVKEVESNDLDTVIPDNEPELGSSGKQDSSSGVSVVTSAVLITILLFFANNQWV